MELVSVQYKFEYTANDGRLVSIKPNESYILVSKTNKHWWHVCKDQRSKPFYIPAQYVKELSPNTGAEELQSPEGVADRTTSSKAASAIPVPVQVSSRGKYRFSTFGFGEDLKFQSQTEGSLSKRNSICTFVPTVDKIRHTSAGNVSITSATLDTDEMKVSKNPHPLPKVENGQPQKTSSQENIFLDTSFPSPPTFLVHDTVPEITITEWEDFSELPHPCPDPDPDPHPSDECGQSKSEQQNKQVSLYWYFSPKLIVFVFVLMSPFVNTSTKYILKDMWNVKIKTVYDLHNTRCRHSPGC